MTGAIEELVKTQLRKYWRQVVYVVCSCVALLAMLYVATPYGSPVLSLISILPVIILAVATPCVSARVRAWLCTVDEPAKPDRLSLLWQRVYAGWAGGSVPEGLGLVRPRVMDPEEKAGIEVGAARARERIEQERRMPGADIAGLDKRFADLTSQVYRATHVTPELLRGVDGDGYITLVFTAVPPITPVMIVGALRENAETVFALPCDPPVIKERTVELAVHVDARAGWSQ